MIIKFINTTADCVKIMAGKDNNISIIKPYDSLEVINSSVEIVFSLCPTQGSNFGFLKDTMFSVMTTYITQCNDEVIYLLIVKQEALDKSFKKYLRYSISDNLYFSKITNTLVDKNYVLKREKKRV